MPNLIADYIASYTSEAQHRLQQIYVLLEEIMPDAEQKISYGMPTFRLGKTNVVHFAAFTNHVSLFPSPDTIVHFASKLAPYKTSKGTIQFQNDAPLPLDLIQEIVRWRKNQIV